MFKECEQCGCKLQCHGTCESDADDVVSALRKALEVVTDTAHHTRCREVTGYGDCNCHVSMAARALAATKGD